MTGCALEIGANLEHLMILIGASLSPIVAGFGAWLSHHAGRRTLAALEQTPATAPPVPADRTVEDIRNRPLGG